MTIKYRVAEGKVFLSREDLVQYFLKLANDADFRGTRVSIKDILALIAEEIGNVGREQ